MKSNKGFASHFAQHEEEIRRYIFSLVHNEVDTDDIMQETAIALWKRSSDYDSSRPFLPWALRFAYFQTKRFQEKSARRLRLDSEVVELLASTYEDDLAYLEAQRQAVGECLNKLEDKDRKLVNLRYAYKLSLPKLAEKLGKQYSRLNTYRVLEKLRLKLLKCVDSVLLSQGWKQ